jgi:flagellar biosynthetic protein FliR
MAMGILARTVPQMNIFVIGLPVGISLGLLMLALSVPLMVGLLKELFIGLQDDLAAIMMAM